MIAWSDYPTGSHRLSCPSCCKGPRDKSAGLTIDPDGRGVLHCFRCSLVETHRPDPGSLRTTAPRRPQLTLKRTALSDWGAELWSGCRNLSGVALEYLHSRRCAIPPATGHLRWHPSLKHPSGHVGPALVALITHVHTKRAMSLHRTWITASGKADVEPAKLLLKGHEIAMGCIRLWPDEDATTTLGIAEGIETALSLAWGLNPVWATIDAGHMEQFPVLDGIATLVIAQDQDPAGVKAASTCARRWAGAGREVLVTNQSTNDLNDLLREVAA